MPTLVQPGDVGIDFSGAKLDAPTVAQNAAKFVIRYSAGVGNAAKETQFKLCRPGEIEAAVAAGLDFIANSEWYESRITEGARAGAADGAADLKFWKSRGLAKGASIYVSWDQKPARLKWRAAKAYLVAYDKALGGYYHVDCYAGTPFLRYALSAGVIKYGWRPNAGSWSSDGLPYQPKITDALLEHARAATPAHIWQTGSYWFKNNADEDVILRAPVGSHLAALAATAPRPPVVLESHPASPLSPPLESDMPLIIRVDKEDCAREKANWPGCFLLAGGLAHLVKYSDLVALKKAGVKEATVSLATYRNLGGK